MNTINIFYKTFILHFQKSNFSGLTHAGFAIDGKYERIHLAGV